MKKLTNLKGVKTLNSKDQKNINGAFLGISCYQQSGNICCQTFPNGYILCEHGKCSRNGQRCIFL